MGESGLSPVFCCLAASRVAASLFGATLITASTMPDINASETAHVYLGTNQSGSGTGFSRARFDAATGTLSAPELITVAPDPAFFAIHPDGRHLYTCNSGAPGGISAYEIGRGTGALTLLNARPSPEPRGPSHISLDRTGRFVLDANYGGGHVRVHALLGDGSLGEQTAFVEHQGRSVHPQRQTRPYAHWFHTDPSNRFALAADLGTDRVVVYRFDAASGALTPNDPPHASVKPGSGPRHLAWHPNGRFVYVVQEIANAVTAFSWDSSSGVLTDLQTVPSLPVEFTGENTAAEIAVHANGRFLYTSNRGHHSIAVLAIDETTGRLAPRQHIGTEGKTPRYFAFDLTNRWLIVLNQDSDNAAIFRVDADTGVLTLHGKQQTLARPCGIAFLEAR